VAKAKEALAVADLIGGEGGGLRHAHVGLFLSTCLLRLGETAAAACAACSSLQTARASGNISHLVGALSACGNVAKWAPNEMAKAERESREQLKRLGGSPPSYGRHDLSQEGHISLPTSPAALSRLCITYMEATVALCDAALAAAGGRDSPAAADDRLVPSLSLEAEARGSLGGGLDELGLEPQRSLELHRQSVALLRLAVQAAAPGNTQNANLSLARMLFNLAVTVLGHNEVVEAAAYMRETLELGEETGDVALKQMVLLNLSNMSARPDQPVGPAEAAALRSRLNALYSQAGRDPDTSCAICLEPLEQPAGGAEQDATDDGGLTADGYTNSAVHVLQCAHQFHRGCLSVWWRTSTRSDVACPLCKE